MSKKRSKQKWNQAWVNQTELGREFGMSAIALGKELTKLNLKDGRGATEKAISEEYAVAAPLADGRLNFRWHKARCVDALRGAGLQRLSGGEVRAATERAEAMSIAREIDRLQEEGDKMADLYFDVLDPEMAQMVESCLDELRS
jgi:hypothetical protein